LADGEIDWISQVEDLVTVGEWDETGGPETMFTGRQVSLISF